MPKSDKDITSFFNSHPVFTIDEFRRFLSLPPYSVQASAIMFHQKKMGRVGIIKNGLYFAIRPGRNARNTSVDPYLVASKQASDVVLAYQAALDVLGLGQSVVKTYHYFSNGFPRALKFQNKHFRLVAIPEQLETKSKQKFGVEKVDRAGLKLNVTGRERTLVEALERPHYCGGLKETYRSLEKIRNIKPDIVLEYLDLREQKNLYAQVGFFLEQHRDAFRVEDSFLMQLAHSIPSGPTYWLRYQKGGKLASRWKLIVPDELLQRNWE